MPISPIEILRGARALLADPSRWTRGVIARNTKGEMVEPMDPHACSFCVLGALERQLPPHTALYPQELMDAEQALVKAIAYVDSDNIDVGAFNDDELTTHEKVLSVLDRAIKELETA